MASSAVTSSGGRDRASRSPQEFEVILLFHHNPIVTKTAHGVKRAVRQIPATAGVPQEAFSLARRTRSEAERYYDARIGYGYGYVKRHNRYKLIVLDASVVIGQRLLGNVVDLQLQTNDHTGF
jgi:hypothetical protein